jgi:hypothetical protein
MRSLRDTALAVIPLTLCSLLAGTTAASAGSFAAQLEGPDSFAFSVVADSDNNVYTTGRFKNTIDLDPGPGVLNATSNGDQDVYVVKLDPNGALIWGRTFGGPGADVPYAGVAVDATGNVFIPGYFQQTADFDPGSGTATLTASAALDTFVLKLDSSGEFLWTQRVGGNTIVIPYGIVIDPGTGDLCISGSYLGANHTTPGTIDFDPDPVDTFNLSCVPGNLGGGSDGFVFRWTSDGDFLWAKQFTGGATQARSIALDPSGNIYTAGTWDRTTDFDPGAGTADLSATNQGAFVTKLTPAGAFLWAAPFEGSGNEAVNGVAVDAAGNAYTTGYYNSTTDFDPGAGTFNLTTAGGNTAFASKLDANGDFVWAKSFPTNNGYGTSIAVDGNANAYFTGFFGNTTDFDPGPGVANLFYLNGNKYVVKLDSNGVFGWARNFGYIFGNSYDIAVDQASNVLVTGQFCYNGDFDPGPDSLILYAPNVCQAFVLKLDPNGDFTAASDQPPLADAGADFSVNEGQLAVALDGTGSSDPDADPLSFAWVQTAGTAVALTGANTATPQFDAPVVPIGGETLTFELTLTANGVEAQDTVNVTVVNVNHPPVADAGVDQSIAEGAPVTLHGEDSFDIDTDPFSFGWTQTMGPVVVLSGSGTANPTFTAPVVAGGGAPGVVATLVFELVVDDDFPADAPAPGYTLANSIDSVTIEVTNVNNPPTADSGGDQTVDENSAVSLTGTASSDPDSDPLTFAWLQTAGPIVALAGADTATPSFSAPFVNPGGADLEFELTVDDGYAGGKDTDMVVVHLQNANDPPLASAAEPTEAVLWPPNHGLVAIGILGVTDSDNNATITIDSVTQDEPTNGLGDGDTAIDAVINGDGTVLIRAERSGSEDGRVYHIHFTASDFEGSSSGVVTVSVPKSKKKAAVDSGGAFPSTE